MAVTRTTLLGGPAAATFNGHTFFARDGILVTPALELEAVDSDAQGVLDATATPAPVMIKFTPSAPFADLIALYPWLEGAPGTSLFRVGGCAAGVGGGEWGAGDVFGGGGGADAGFVAGRARAGVGCGDFPGDWGAVVAVFGGESVGGGGYGGVSRAAVGDAAVGG